MEAKNPTESRIRILWTLFGVCLRISAFTFGGGFVIIGFMKRYFVDRLGWISEEEMLDYAALAQSTPGPIAVNVAIMIGRQAAGTPGMITAVLGTVIPPIVILSVISVFYSRLADNPFVSLFLRGLQAGIAAVVLDVACSLGKNILNGHSWIHDVLIGAAFTAAFILKVPVIWIFLGGLAAGVILFLLERRKTA
jgi:Chromate transport protein ChrA